MKGVNKILKEQIFSSYWIRALGVDWGLRIVFFLTSFLIYWVVDFWIPMQISFGRELSLLFALVIAVIILLPFYDKLFGKLRGFLLSEFLVEDLTSSKLAYRKFDYDSLIKSVFPDMVRLSGSSHGRLAILSAEGKDYELYIFTRQRQRKVLEQEGVDPHAPLMLYLARRRAPVRLGESDQSEGVKNDFHKLKAEFVLPFLYREKLFGFIALSSNPPAEVSQEMHILGGKSALAIHNHILSSQIAENRKYRKELENAGKIRRFLESLEIPDLGPVKAELINHDPSTLIEFHRIDENTCYLVILTLRVMNPVSVLVLSYVMGIIYAKISYGDIKGLNDLKELIENSMKEISWKEHYDLLVAAISSETKTINVRISSPSYRGFRRSAPARNLLSLGWENKQTLDYDPFVLSLREKEILSLDLKPRVELKR